MGYLDEFRTALDRRWKGRLVRVHDAVAIEPRAKEYMASLARRGMIERVTWGWYWIPGPLKDFLTFLAKEQTDPNRVPQQAKYLCTCNCL